MLSKEELEKLYIAERKTGDEIASIAGVSSPQTIYNWLDKYGIERRDRSSCQNPFYIDKDTLMELYINKKYTSEQIGKMFGASKVTILKFLKKYKINRRNRWYAIAGWGANKPMPESQKKKISEAAKKRVGEKAPRYGAVLSVETRNKIANTLKGKYRDSNNPNWKGGDKYERNQWQSRYEYKEWRKAVFERDCYTCQMCGKKSSGDIEAHHIYTWKNYPEKRFDVENGITLCKKCHRSIKEKEDEYINMFIGKRE